MEAQKRGRILLLCAAKVPRYAYAIMVFWLIFDLSLLRATKTHPEMP